MNKPPKLPGRLGELPVLYFSRGPAPADASRETLDSTVFGVRSLDTVVKEFDKREASLRKTK